MFNHIFAQSIELYSTFNCYFDKKNNQIFFLGIQLVRKYVAVISIRGFPAPKRFSDLLSGTDPVLYLWKSKILGLYLLSQIARQMYVTLYIIFIYSINAVRINNTYI